MSVFCLGASDIERLWIEIAPFLKRLEDETGHLLASDLKHELVEARNQLWGYQTDAIRSVAVTRVSETSRGRLCEILGAAGHTNRDETQAVLACIEEWARGIGCTRVRFGGRSGWKRLTRDIGYAEAGIILEKAL